MPLAVSAVAVHLTTQAVFATARASVFVEVLIDANYSKSFLLFCLSSRFCFVQSDSRIVEVTDANASSVFAHSTSIPLAKLIPFVTSLSHVLLGPQGSMTRLVCCWKNFVFHSYNSIRRDSYFSMVLLHVVVGCSERRLTAGLVSLGFQFLRRTVTYERHHGLFCA